MEKPVIQYTIRPQANRASGGVINVPAIIGREDSVPLELIVDRAIDRGLIVAIKPNAAKSVADGVAKQMFEEFRNGNGVKFGDYFYARLYLDGTTDGSGTLVEGRNGINVRLYKGNGFKLGLKDFSWQFAEAENIAAIDYLVSDADGAQRGILMQPAQSVGNGNRVLRIGQQCTVPHDLREGGCVRDQHGRTAGHRFERRQTEALIQRRKDEGKRTAEGPLPAGTERKKRDLSHQRA